jgi:predicted transcriptional regulator
METVAYKAIAVPSEPRLDSAPRKGFFMSVEEEKQARALVLLDYNEHKQKLALLQEQAQKFAKKFEELAQLLKHKPDRIHPDLGNLKESGLPSYESLATLSRDITETQQETTRLAERVRQLGFIV